MRSQKKIIEVLRLLENAYDDISMLGDFSQKRYSSFRILISTILSARAKDEMTIPVSNALFKKYPTAKALSKAKKSDVENIIKKIGFYKNKAKYVIDTAKIVYKKYKGRAPNDKGELLKLPGVGSKVANCVLVYVFDRPFIPVDTHVHRISNRLGWVRTTTPEKTELELEKIVPKKYWTIINEIFVLHGQHVCEPISPFCSECIIKQLCPRIGVKKYR